MGEIAADAPINRGSAGIVLLHELLDDFELFGRGKRGVQLNPGGGGIRISFPQKFAGTPVTVTADNVSLYDVLRLVCENAGLKLLMEDPDIVVLSGSGSKQSDAGKKNGSGK